MPGGPRRLPVAQSLLARAKMATHQALLGEFLGTLVGDMLTSTSPQQVAATGQQLAVAIQNLINSYAPPASGDTPASAAQAIQTQAQSYASAATAWTSQANAAASAAQMQQGFDAGSAGGGSYGGGGASSDQGAADDGSPDVVSDTDQATQDFRQSGVDPFDDGSDASVSNMVADDGSNTDEVLGEDGLLMWDLHEMQITDREPNEIRQNASVHRGGAAYLEDFVYPVHGASTGRQGGSMDPREKISIFGGVMSAYGKGQSAIAAKATGPGSATTKVTYKVPLQRAGFVAKQTPAGKTITSLVTRKGGVFDHKTAIANAKDVAKRAISVGTKVQKAGTVKKAHILGATSMHKAYTAAQVAMLGKKAVEAGKQLASMASKQDDYTEVDIEFQAFADTLNRVINVYTNS
jgi:hypothetical protein